MQTVPGFDLFEPTDVLVLGVGNILWADEGFGVRCVERFNELYRAPEKVKVMDGGTLDIAWSEVDNHVYMTGPAEFAFEGEIEI